MATLVAAIDLGGTAMKGGLVYETGAVERLESRATGREEGPEAVLDRLAAFAGDLIAAASGRAAALGLAVAGLVDEERGVARASVNLGWRDVPLRERLEDRLGLPVAVSHDVRAAARAEGAAGAARGRDDWLLVTLGTGVGAALVVRGVPYAGAHGTGGELGHLVVDPNGPPCGCGARGCVEALASAAAVERRYAERAGAAVDAADAEPGGAAPGPAGMDDEEVVPGRAAPGPDRVDAREVVPGRAAPGPDRVDAREVLRRAQAGDEAAEAVWREAVEALAAGLAGYVVVMDPALIVVGGGLASAGAALLDPLSAALARRLTFVAAPPVVAAELGAEAGCRGAALAAWELVRAG